MATATAAPTRAKTLSINRGAYKIRYWAKGKGKPLLFLHGVEGIDRWPDWLDAFTRNHLVIAPQLPGYGESAGLDNLDDFLDLSLYHSDLLKALGLKKTDIIGHDFGGLIAAEFAVLFPGQVGKLVLVAPTGIFDEKNTGVDFFAITPGDLDLASWHDFEGAKAKGFIEEPKDEAAKKNAIVERAKAFSTAGKFIFPIPDKGLKKRAHRIQAPTLLVWGASDKIMPPSYARRFKALIKGSKVVTIAKAGHQVMREQPAQFTKAVKSWIG